MVHNEKEILRISGVSIVNQYRHAQTDGNLLREHINHKRVICIALGRIEGKSSIVMVIKPAPNTLVADYVFENDSIFDFLMRIIKDLMVRHQKVKNFVFNPKTGVCEFTLLESKPGSIEVVRMRFTDKCIMAGQSGKIYQIALVNNRPWFVHKLPNEGDKINFLTMDGALADQVSCNCFFSVTEKKCAHKTLVRTYLTEVLNVPK